VSSRETLRAVVGQGPASGFVQEEGRQGDQAIGPGDEDREHGRETYLDDPGADEAGRYPGHAPPRL